MTSARLREYTNLLNRLIHLEQIGRFESEDAEHIRDLMDDCWRGFSAEEAREARQLSEVLQRLEEEL